MEKFQKSALITLFILTTSILRLIPHLPNFTPIGALGLFGGAYFGKKRSILTVIAAMLLSDYLLLYVNPYSPRPVDFSHLYAPTALVHSTSLFVYAGLLINVIIGWKVARNKSVANIITASLLASVQFFLITNFGVWVSGYYPQNIHGLLQSYIAGLPFFRWTLIGDLFYTTMLFGSYELVFKHSTAKLRLKA